MLAPVKSQTRLPTREQTSNKALKSSGSPSEIRVYDQSQHGFHADYRPSYDPEAAKDGWQRLQQWFRQHGAA